MHRLSTGVLAAGLLALSLPIAAQASDVDAMKTAASLPLGESRDSAIEAGERECYRVANAGKAVVIHIEPNEQGEAKTPLFNRAVRVYDPSGAKLAEREEMADDELTLSVSTQAQSLFVCIGGAHDGWIGEYRLRVEA